MATINANVRNQLEEAARVLRQVADGKYAQPLDRPSRLRKATLQQAPLIDLAESLEALARLAKRRSTQDKDAATRK